MVSLLIIITKDVENIENTILKIILCNNHYYLNFNVGLSNVARNKDEKHDYHA